MKNIYLLFIGLLLGVIISCTEVNLEMEYPEISSKGEKIQVCHFDEKTNSWSTIFVSADAIKGHKNHGDVVIDEDGDGYALFNECGILNSNGIDCDDTDNTISPSASEICGDGVDNDCDEFIDECGTYVPDDNFEQALIDLGYDIGPLDDYVPTEKIAGVTSLRVSNKSIRDLTGIEDFTSIVFLGCNNNDITSLDVSNNKSLTSLNCYYNPLTNLNVSGASALKSLFCYGHELTNLDISNNLNLERLSVNGGKLGTIDVSKNTKLTFLSCNNSKLTTLDVSNNTALTSLYCGWNDLTSLDISINNSLTSLFCSYNDLTNLNAKNGNNTNFTSFKAIDNPNLTCIEVDDESWSTTNWTEIDPASSFSENCSDNSGL
jgi:hypothetical protein